MPPIRANRPRLPHNRWFPLRSNTHQERSSCLLLPAMESLPFLDRSFLNAPPSKIHTKTSKSYSFAHALKIKSVGISKVYSWSPTPCHHYPAVRWANKARGRHGAIAHFFTNSVRPHGRTVRIACRCCDQLKSSCFPRLTGSTAASCDTIWRRCAAQIICR